MEKHRSPTMGATISSESTAPEPRLKTDSGLSYWGVCVWGGGGGIYVFYWYQIFALDSAVVKTQNCLARMETS